MIKQLDNSSINSVMEIWLRTNITAHSFIDKDYWIRNYEVVKNQYIPISKTFIFEEDNKTKAFISIINNSFIGALFVQEEYQGQGIGKQLLNHCKSLYPSLELCVYTENTDAVNFYLLCDFIIVKEQLNEDSGFMEYVMKWIK